MINIMQKVNTTSRNYQNENHLHWHPFSDWQIANISHLEQRQWIKKIKYQSIIFKTWDL